MKRLRNLICLVSVALLMHGCDEENQQYIPYVQVDIYLNLSLPAYQTLNFPNEYIYINGGSRGIVVYNDNGTYRCFDRHSPYEPQNNCMVSVNTGTIIAEDPCSGSQFILTDGSVVGGPATLPLKPYHNTFDGTTIHITN